MVRVEIEVDRRGSQPVRAVERVGDPVSLFVQHGPGQLYLVEPTGQERLRRIVLPIFGLGCVHNDDLDKNIDPRYITRVGVHAETFRQISVRQKTLVGERFLECQCVQLVLPRIVISE